MALTTAQMMGLLADKPGKKKAIASQAWVKVTEPGEDHKSSIGQQAVTTAQYGKFHNKAGTKTRSAKGRIRTNPDGYARYIHPGLGGDVEVVAYQA